LIPNREAVTQQEAAVDSASAFIDASQTQMSHAKTEYSRQEARDARKWAPLNTGESRL